MNEDYLWDKAGEPDPEIQRLEALLRPLGHKAGAIPEWPAPRKNWLPLTLAMAASVLIVFGTVWMIGLREHPGWHVTAVEGKPGITRLSKGQSYTTDHKSRIRLDMDDVGEVLVEPNSKMSVIATRPEEQRLSLEHGMIRAEIWAPPGRFYVNTPSAQAVDLGCQYTLEVNDKGEGLVRVIVGWVAFENDGRESFIPAEAACVTRPGKGPGIPYYADATQALRDAVNRFDINADESAEGVILAQARERDAISLWHLLRRVPAADRGRVYDRLSQLMKMPADVTRDGVVAANAQMIDSLWNALDLGTTSWWRTWKTHAPK
jgi:FecR protein